MTQALKDFRTYHLAVAFYRLCQPIKLGHAMKDQLMRAASSIVLNLAEGSAKPSAKERLRFYGIAFGSMREIQAIIELADLQTLESQSDHLAASLYKLAHPRK